MRFYDSVTHLFLFQETRISATRIENMDLVMSRSICFLSRLVSLVVDTL